MSTLTTAVIGVGYLGKWHADKYAALDNSKLVAVVDVDASVANEIAGKHDVEALTEHKSLLGKVDAVSIATPTTLHYGIARDFLEHGSHVLIEKPIATTLDEADDLIELARTNDLLLQVGHQERFNAAILDLGDTVDTPRFMESHRLAPFNPRATDVNVVLDLMIHDLDIILDIVDSPIKHIRASGTPVVTESTDIANARLEFDNGCVANVTASRVSAKAERKIRIFQSNAYITVDLLNHDLSVYKKETGSGSPEITGVDQHYEDNDALNLEIIAFLDSIQNGAPVVVSGEDGRRALDAAITISSLLEE